MQAGELHIDLRLPSEFFRLPAAALAEQEPSSLLLIADVVAFAGKTDIVNSLCTWTRQINYQGRPPGLDIGELSWSGMTLIERGVHEQYEEGWERQETELPQARCFADEQGQLLFVCSVSDRFAMARAHPANMQELKPLADRVSDALAVDDETALMALFDQEFCFGQFENGYARILHSSNPSRVGNRVFRTHGPLAEMNTIDIVQNDFLGRSAVHRYTTNTGMV